MERRRAILLLAFPIFLAGGSPASAALPEESSSCLACHADPKTAPRPRLEDYELSVHKDLSCTVCHAQASEIPHPQTMSKPDCGLCHSDQASRFAGSVHGAAAARGIREAPLCAGCHGEHGIRSSRGAGAARVRASLIRNCSDCHASERLSVKFGLPVDRVKTFERSFHGLAGRSGDLRVADCGSCHGWHDVLPSSDPRSRVHPANLAKTCAECHPGAGARLAASGGRIHASLSGEGRGSRVAGLARAFYLFVIPLSLAFMAAHNGADLLRKATAGHPLPRLREEEEVLLPVPERFQHAVLVLSFMILAYSGFALKYHDRWWAAPWAAMGGEEIRRWTHRGAALVFVLLGAGHAAYLASRAGRGRLRLLLPAWRDAGDFLALTAFNLRRSPRRPLLPRFSYIEKFEYWALLWGSGVMVATGALLLFHNFALARLPLWLIETAGVVHFLEAVLACAAIALWHFYWVIFDPEVYPLNWAWLLGRSRWGKARDRSENIHPDS